MTLLWYAAYGSNLSSARLRSYLCGGAAPGSPGGHRHVGCRDASPPRDSRDVDLPGQVYFALESAVWSGGLALYDPRPAPGPTPARAHLLTADQLVDLAVQEMHRVPGADPDADAAVRRGLDTAAATGRAVLGPGRYETVVRCGALAGVPVLTLTAPWSSGDVTPTRPAGAYLRMLAAGLAEARGWSAPRIAAHLASLPGVRGEWDEAELTALVEATVMVEAVGSDGTSGPVGPAVPVGRAAAAGR